MFESARKTSQNFSLYPLAWLAAAFAAGILIENIFSFSLKIYPTLCLFSAVCAGFFYRKTYNAVFLMIAFASLGGFCFLIEKTSIATDRLKTLYENGELISGEPVSLTGVVCGKPETAVGGFFLELRAESVSFKNSERKVSGKARFFAFVLTDESNREYEKLKLRYGTRLRVSGNLQREEKFLNPGAVSQKQLLDQKEIDATGTIKSPLLIEYLGETGDFAPFEWAFEKRQDLISEFKKYFSVSAAGVLIASLLGNKYHLDKSTSEIFREGGIFHFLVISGLHITFIGALAILLLRRITKSRVLQFIFANAFLWIYAIAVGAGAPVVRAALMFTILYFARVIYRQSNLLNALGAAALMLLVRRPSDLFDQSFQLTFACVFAIVAMAFPLLERLRAIGEWQPSAETAVPPDCSKNLKNFCEALYWSEANWRREQQRSIWQANLFKAPFAERLERWGIQKILRYVFEMILVSIIVQAWLVPFLIVYFHRVSLVSIFLNIWVGILVAVEGLAALAAIYTAAISEILALPLIKLAEAFNWILINLGEWFIETGNGVNLRPPHYAGRLRIVYFLYYLPLIALTFCLFKWNPFALKKNGAATEKENRIFRLKSFSIVACGCLLAFILFHPFSSPVPDGRRLQIDFLDVGQGDAALITMPTGETLLIDGGGRADFKRLFVKHKDGEQSELFEPDVQRIGESVVSAFLWEKGYDRVDFILATHADTDHMQGLTDIARNFKIQTAFFGAAPFSDEDFTELYQALKEREVPMKIISRGDSINFGAVRIEVLCPERNDNGAESADALSENNRSIVLRVNYGNRKILLTGDIERETENELLQRAHLLLRADVVKVAHHGSKTSSARDFIERTKAALAVISVGRKSPFGHPKSEVVERWKNFGAKVLTTGENGTITVSTDGNDLRLTTFAGKTPVYR